MTVSLVLVNKESLKIKRYMIVIKIIIPKGCQKRIEECRGDQEEPKA